MKVKKIRVLSIALAIIFSANTSLALAATSNQVKSETVDYNGQNKTVNVMSYKGKKLYNYNQAAKVLGLSISYNKSSQVLTLKRSSNGYYKTMQFNLKKKVTYLNNQKISGVYIPVRNGSSFYGTLIHAINLMDYETTVDSNLSLYISNTKMASGTYEAPTFMSNGLVLVKDTSKDNAKYVLINTTTRKVIKNFYVEEMSVSNDRAKAIYADENGTIFVYDFTTNKSRALAMDSSAKFDFTWSQDDSKVYYISGDKADTVAVVDMEDGLISPLSKVLPTGAKEEIMDATGNITQSAVVGYTGLSELVLDDSNGVLYVQTAKQAVVHTQITGKDENGNDIKENVSIDTTGTESLVYSIKLDGNYPQDLLTNQVTPASMTDIKEFIVPISNDSFTYLSSDENGTTTLKLYTISTKTASNLLTGKDIVDIKSVNNKDVYVLTNTETSSEIYKIDTSTKAIVKVLTSKKIFTSLAVSNDGKFVAMVAEGNSHDSVMLYDFKKLKNITK